MSIEIKTPQLPESVSDATIVTWHKAVGETITQDENLVDLETDKVILEVVAPATGRLSAIERTVGTTVQTGEILGILEEGAAVASDEEKAQSSFTQSSTSEVTVENTPKEQEIQQEAIDSSSFSTPSARRKAQEKNISLDAVAGTGRSGQITGEDVMQYTSKATETTAKDDQQHRETPTTSTASTERVPMKRLRIKIAERLLLAQQQAAILTTFNEVDLQAVISIRHRYKEKFEKQHGVKLGFMSFFTKAVVDALKQYPIINASVEDDYILYHHFYDIGIAVSTERGLVVPVIRNADQLSFSEIETTINGYGKRARVGQLSLAELTGGTFTITNGGVFGSLLSTPILNPPQSGILGMHKIQERPIVEKGQIVIKPMMYLALSYDHRIIDGKDSVQFLDTVKKLLEDPTQLLLDKLLLNL